MIVKKILLYMLLVLCIAFQACKDDEEEETVVTYDGLSIEEYIAGNQIANTIKTSSGMYYVILEEGQGDFPVRGDRVHVHYTGSFFDGEVFDTSGGSPPFSFVLGAGSVIEGWDEGLEYFKKGGRGILLLPSDLAYGEAGRGSIPSNAPLRFDIQLVDIDK